MSRLRTAAVVLLVALLAVNIIAANALVAADRTVLNAGFVTTTLEEERAYERAEPIVLDQLPTEELDASAMQNFEQAREVVGLIDLLALILPVVGVGLIVLIYLASRSISVTAIWSGFGLAVGGLPTLVGASQVQPLLQSMLGDELPAGIEELLLGIAGQVTDAVFVQSAVVVGLGVVALVAGLALHRGLIRLPTTGDKAE